MLEIFVKASNLLSHDDGVGTYGLCYRNNGSGVFGKTITGVFFKCYLSNHAGINGRKVIQVA